jgi:peptidoglycan hydrolase-like protein with peptidoglycan-binding domain
MDKIMTNKEFVEKAIDIAKNYKTLYVMGCFGAPMTDKNKKRYCSNNKYNKDTARQKMINGASSDTFGFDCVCLIKGILWGWRGNLNHVYGGASYAKNIPDISIATMTGKKYSTGNSSDFSNITLGELLYIGTGHIGIYIGDGIAVECTPAWENKVQITAVGNIGTKAGYSTRKWDKHCKANFIDYVDNEETKPAEPEDNFLGTRGYIKLGDKGDNVDKISKFMYMTFPAYTSKKALGNYYGKYIQASIKEFQRRTGLEQDGCVGPKTLAKLVEYGFKY